MFTFSNILESVVFSAPMQARTPSDLLESRMEYGMGEIFDTAFGGLPGSRAEYDMGEIFDTIFGGLPIFHNDPPQDDQFWDSVKVTTPIDKIPTAVVDNYECAICGNEEREILKLPCCKGRMCKKCGVNWFEKESSNCPYCKKDLRTIGE